VFGSWKILTNNGGAIRPLKVSNNISLIGMIGILIIFAGSLLLLFIPPQKTTKWNGTDSFKPINLAALPWYAHKGFIESDTGGFNITDLGVKKIDSFPIRLNRVFDIPLGNSQNEFSLMTNFICDEKCTGQSLSLYLAEVGENWAVYLNGKEIIREIYLNSTGQMNFRRTIQRALIPIPNNLVKVGDNTLVIQIIGNADVSRWFSGMMPGFSMSTDYLIGNTTKLIQLRSVNEAINWFQVGVYLFFGILQFSLFYRRKEPYYHYFGMFLITCVIYSVASSNISYNHAYDTALIVRYMYSTNIIWSALIGLSIWNFLYQKKSPKILKSITYASVGVIIGILFLPLPWVEVLFSFSLIIIAIVAIYLITIIITAMKAKIPGARQLMIAGSFIGALIGFALADWFFYRRGYDFISWIPFCLAIAFTSILIDRFWNLTVELTKSNTQLSIIRDEMEAEVVIRTSELRNTNSLLEDKFEEISILHKKMSEMALHDTLTGLLNRRFLAETLDREFSRAKRENQPVSLLMIDIDHFKLVNDSFGHKAGDEVLKSFAEHLLAHIRQEDIAFRYGGEEFLVVLPGASLCDSQLRADNIRKMVEDIGFYIEDKHGQITVSVGIAEYPGNGSTPDEVLTKADAALYAAKRAGRNRVEAAIGTD
jgi:diguanylate cyclase (GGDEF)-like protein